MPLKGQDLGLKADFRGRVGVNLPRFRGVNKQFDAGAIGDDEFQALENVVHDGQKILTRPGLTKVNSGAAVTGCLYGIFDDGGGNFGGNSGGGDGGGGTPGGGGGTVGVRLYGANDGVGGVVFDDELSPQYGTVQGGTNNFGESGVALGGRLLFGGTIGGVGGIYTLTPAAIPTGSTITASQPPPALLFKYPSGFTFLGMTHSPFRYGSDPVPGFEGTLFLTGHVSGTVVTYRYDGLSLIQDEAFAAAKSAESIMGRLSDMILNPNVATGNNARLRYRNSAGTWATLADPGLPASFAAYHIAEYAGLAYISGKSNNRPYILSFDGSALAIARGPIGNAGATSAGSLSLAVYNGKLYFLWYETVAGVSTIYVGQFDGSTWTEAHKSLSGQFSLTGYSPYGMGVYKGNLVVAVDDGASSSKLLRSPGVTTSGTWVALFDGTTSQWGATTGGPGFVVL